MKTFGEKTLKGAWKWQRSRDFVARYTSWRATQQDTRFSPWYFSSETKRTFYPRFDDTSNQWCDMQLSVSFDYKVFPSLNTSLLKHFVLRGDGNWNFIHLMINGAPTNFFFVLFQCRFRLPYVLHKKPQITLSFRGRVKSINCKIVNNA